jgi:hypothetical protein
MLCELRHMVSYVLCIYCALLCIDCARLCAQLPIPQKENSSEIFRDQGKYLVISGTSDCALYFCYHICGEILAEAVKEMVLWYFIYGPFYFCSLDSQEF